MGAGIKFVHVSFIIVASFSMIFLFSLSTLQQHSGSSCSCDSCLLERGDQSEIVEDIFSIDIATQEPMLPLDSSSDFAVPTTDDVDLLPKDDDEMPTPTWDASFRESDYIRAKFDDFCYKPQPPYYDATKYSELRLSPEMLKKKGCRQRLPTVIIPGARKCGTGALLKFLFVHPNITGPPGEIHYFSSRTDTNLSEYRSKMPFTTQYQITMEKTPTYFYRPFNTPQLIQKELSTNTKIIMVLCDPVRRAVSDYLEFIWRDVRKHDDPRYRAVKETFEETIDDSAMFYGGVQPLHEIIDVGIYVKHLIRWFDAFPRDQILLLDGTHLSTDPFPELQRVEKFLGLRSYFRKEHFSFNEERGLFCIEFPSNFCLSKAKGREHPRINAKTWQNMCDFYAPYNKALVDMTGQNFTWVGKCPEQY